MIDQGIILVSFILFYLFEVWHDFTLSKIRVFLRIAMRQVPGLISDEEERELNGNWHAWDFRSHTVVALCVTGIAFNHSRDWRDLLIVIGLACMRMLILNIGHKLKAGETWTDLGDGKIDQALQKMFGKWWPLPISLILLTIIAIRVL